MVRRPDAAFAAEPTFFVDRSLGRYDVVSALRFAGAHAEAHDDHFEGAADDVTWLAEVASRGWAVLTKDDHIRRREAELKVLREAGVAAFILPRANMTAAAMSTAFVQALPRMRGLLRTHARPLIARVTVTGGVQVIEGCRRGGVRRDDADADPSR